MLELAKYHKSRFSFFSSSEIYGDPDSKNVPIQESCKEMFFVKVLELATTKVRVGETLC